MEKTEEAPEHIWGPANSPAFKIDIAVQSCENV